MLGMITGEQDKTSLSFKMSTEEKEGGNQMCL